ncbi:serine hydrolase domain-containing protein [Streptomyces sp. NPDC059443]|uniref:serine hydrolase domain-containing protein n=1 Tax=unclassified Streptomyces TaxID=2593676 RepID=UPI0036CCEC7A
MRRLRNALLGAAVGLAVTVGATPAQADMGGAAQALQDGANKGVAAGYPGVIALMQDSTSGAYVTAGHSIKGSSVPIDPTAKYRIGSNTKLYTATVVLQLEAEGKLSLDDTVAKWLPNAVNAHGYDGRTITIRQLLNQTSGLPDYPDVVVARIPFVDPITLGYVYYNGDLRSNHYTPQSLVDMALTLPKKTPGEWAYANTNYVLAGMIIQAATGHDPSVEIANRVIAPLGLTGTSFPTSDTNLYGNFVHGWKYNPLGGIDEVSASNVELFWAAGAMISTLQDQAVFVLSLLQGRLLPPAQLTELKTTVGMDPKDPQNPDKQYGLALSHRILTGCQKGAWAHGGAVLGYNSRWYASEDGTKVVVALGNEEHGGDETAGVIAIRNGVQATLCQMLS